MKHSEAELWLDTTKRNPKQDGESFSAWLSRLSEIMAKARREEADTEVTG